MDEGADMTDETDQKSQSKRSIIGKGLDYSLERSGSFLNVFIPKKPLLRKSITKSEHQKNEQGQTEEKPQSPRKSAIQEHRLMKPIHPPLPRAKTIGSLDTVLRQSSTECSPPRPNRYSMTNLEPPPPLLSQSEDKITQREAALAQSNRATQQASFRSIRLRPVNPDTKKADSINNSSSTAKPHNEETRMKGPFPSHPYRAQAPVVSTKNASNLRRRTMSPSSFTREEVHRLELSEQQRSSKPPAKVRRPSFAKHDSVKKLSRLSESGFPPSPEHTKIMGEREAPETEPAGARQHSARVMSSPNVYRQRVQTPHHTSRVMSTPSMSNSARRATRIPTPVRPARLTSNSNLQAVNRNLTHDSTRSRRYSPRPSYDPNRIQFAGSIKNPRITPLLFPSKTQPLLPRLSSGTSDQLLPSSPSLHEGRYGQEFNRLTSHTMFSDTALPLSANCSSSISSRASTPDPIVMAARRDAERSGHLGLVDQDMPTQYWLGRYVGKSDRLRTADVDMKAGTAWGDPGRPDHPANTGMLDDQTREKYVLEYLVATCANEEARASFDRFLERKIENKRRAALPKPQPKAEPKKPVPVPPPAKPNVFDRLKKRSKTFGKF